MKQPCQSVTVKTEPVNRVQSNSTTKSLDSQVLAITITVGLKDIWPFHADSRSKFVTIARIKGILLKSAEANGNLCNPKLKPKLKDPERRYIMLTPIQCNVIPVDVYKKAAKDPCTSRTSRKPPPR